MAWAFRNGRSYYYRSKRVAGKVKTEVFGGSCAILEAQADEEAKYKREREAESLAEEDRFDEELEKLIGAIEEFTAERLHAAGYHQHRREWRKRRGGVG
jgi:hypothetical protein